MSSLATTSDKDLVKELKSSFMNNMAEAANELLPLVVERVLVDEDLEQQRKFLTMAVDVLGWKQAAPKDAYENLPIFQFNFGPGGVSAEMVRAAAQPVEMVEEVAVNIAATTALDDLAPTPAMAAAAARVNLDVIE